MENWTLRILLVAAMGASVAASASESASGTAQAAAKAAVKVHRARYFEQGKTEGTPLYTSTAEISAQEGSETVVITYLDPQGAVAETEKYWLDGGGQIKKAEIDQKQLKQTATVEVKDGRVYFSTTDEGGKTRKSDEGKEDTFVMPGNFQRFVRDHWTELDSGQTVEFRFGVWDRRETIGFEIRKIGSGEFHGQKVAQLKMNPSSLLISALVKPLMFDFAADGSKLLHSSGRIAPKRKSGDSWKDLDADVVYSYE